MCFSLVCPREFRPDHAARLVLKSTGNEGPHLRIRLLVKPTKKNRHGPGVQFAHEIREILEVHSLRGKLCQKRLRRFADLRGMPLVLGLPLRLLGRVLGVA